MRVSSSVNRFEVQVSCLLTIAGTDPSGGAGIPVDLQVFRDCGYHGLSVVAAVVAQNTAGVRGFEVVEPECVAAQLEAVFDDIPVAGIKIGMLGSAETVEVVVDVLRNRAGEVPVVVDPVLASGSGTSALYRSGLVEAMREKLVPEVDCLTPNIPEAKALLDDEINDEQEMFEAAEALCDLGPGSVLLKGGHLSARDDEETIRDVFAEGGEAEWLSGMERIGDDVRGTGCQLSSALCAELADGESPRESAERARAYLNRVIREQRSEIGGGRPVVVRAERTGEET